MSKMYVHLYKQRVKEIMKKKQILQDSINIDNFLQL